MVNSTNFQDKGVKVMYRKGLEEEEILEPGSEVSYKKLDKKGGSQYGSPFRQRKNLTQMPGSLQEQHTLENSIVEHWV